jgi:PAS domain S-box-containing protein
VATKPRRRPRRKTPTVDLGIGGWRAPIHSHIAYLWETEEDLARALGFVEAGLEDSDHCILIGDRRDRERMLAVLERRGVDVEGMQARKRLTVLDRPPSAEEMLRGAANAMESAVAAGAKVVRGSGIVGWGRETGPSDAELFSYEVQLTEIAKRFPSVILCLHPLNALTGLIARHGVFGTHPRMLEETGVLGNPFFVPFDRSELLDAVAARLSEDQDTRSELRSKTEILRAIFDNSPLMVSFYDASGRLLFVNREWERVLGWSLAEAQRSDLFSQTYPDPDRRREVFEFMQKAEGRWKDFRTRTRDGKMIDTSWVRVPLSDGTRIGFGLDLSERKRLERGIKTTEALLAEGEKLSHAGSWVLNLASGKIFWSAEVFRIFGLEPGLETPSHPLFRELLRPADWSAAESTIPPEDRPAVQKNFNRAVAERSGFENDHRVVRPDGSVRDVHVVGHPVFGESDELLEYVGVLMDVTERRLAEDRLQKSYEELRALSERLRTVRESERARISREMHDEVGQALTALQMDVAWLEKKLSSSSGLSKTFSAKFRSMAELIDTTTGAVQRIATDLRPGVLDELGLSAAIEWYIHEFERRAGIACQLRSNVDGAQLDPERATAVFRILQEALTNVARHAGATEVEVSLSADDQRLVLEIKDNGRGISEDRLPDSRSLGLLGMRERARSLWGDVSIRGDPGRGTLVTLTIPR